MVTTGSWTGSRIRAAAAASLITLLGGCGGSGNTSGDSSGGGPAAPARPAAWADSDVAGASATVLARINALRAVARQCGSTRFAAAGALSSERHAGRRRAGACQRHGPRQLLRPHRPGQLRRPASRARRAGYTSDRSGRTSARATPRPRPRCRAGWPAPATAGADECRLPGGRAGLHAVQHRTVRQLLGADARPALRPARAPGRRHSDLQEVLAVVLQLVDRLVHVGQRGVLLVLLEGLD